MHMHRVTHSWRQMPYTGAVGSQSQRPGSMGVRCLAQGHLPAVSSPIFERWEWESNRQPSGYWTAAVWILFPRIETLNNLLSLTSACCELSIMCRPLLYRLIGQRILSAAGRKAAWIFWTDVTLNRGFLRMWLSHQQKKTNKSSFLSAGLHFPGAF